MLTAIAEVTNDAVAVAFEEADQMLHIFCRLMGRKVA